jgi:hypothetical protein
MITEPETAGEETADDDDSGGDEHQRVLYFRTKPDMRDQEQLSAARYEPGQPLNAAWAVAQMADQDAEVAEVPLASGTVLLVRWAYHDGGGPPGEEFCVVRAPGYLAYSVTHGLLFAVDDEDLQRYDLASKSAPGPGSEDSEVKSGPGGDDD